MQQPRLKFREFAPETVLLIITCYCLTISNTIRSHIDGTRMSTRANTHTQSVYLEIIKAIIIQYFIFAVYQSSHYFIYSWNSSFLRFNSEIILNLEKQR